MFYKISLTLVVINVFKCLQTYICPIFPLKYIFSQIKLGNLIFKSLITRLGRRGENIFVARVKYLQRYVSGCWNESVVCFYKTLRKYTSLVVLEKGRWLLIGKMADVQL